MKVIKKRLDDLKHPEKNVRIHSEQQIRELKRSLEKFGQTRALVVDENNVILIGNPVKGRCEYPSSFLLIQQEAL